MSATSKPQIFISSTCYDLVDVRAYLRHRLEAWGAIVKLSEDPHSGFAVDPTVNSIESCKQNVETSDVVVCIVDHRYGPPLPDPYGNRSATHVEIDHAVNLGRPILIFIRTLAYQEYQQLNREPSFKPLWVEPENERRRRQWVEFVKKLTALPSVDERNNFFDQFTSCVDLAQVVESRLAAIFPQIAIGPAMQPGRLVRIYFVPKHSDPFTSNVIGHFRNAGPGPAFDLRQGVRIDTDSSATFACGGLGIQEDLALPSNANSDWQFPMGPEMHGALALFCEYSNSHGDRYRVEVPCSLTTVSHAKHDLRLSAPETYQEPAVKLEAERLFVLGGSPNNPQWILAN